MHTQSLCAKTLCCDCSSQLCALYAHMHKSHSWPSVLSRKLLFWEKLEGVRGGGGGGGGGLNLSFENGENLAKTLVLRSSSCTLNWLALLEPRGGTTYVTKC